MVTRPVEALDVGVAATLRACRSTRDVLVIRVTLDAGLRMVEALGLHRGDMHSSGTGSSGNERATLVEELATARTLNQALLRRRNSEPYVEDQDA